MGKRQSIGGRSSLGLYARLIAVLALAALLLFVFLVVVPEFQQQREAKAQRAQATVTAEARGAETQRAYAAGLGFAEAGDWSRAVDEFSKALALDPGYRDTVTRLADARVKIKTSQATATAQSAATAQALSEVESAYQRGIAYLNLQRWEQAQAEFEQVFDVAPTYKDVQARLAEVEARLTEAKAITPTPTSSVTPQPTSSPVLATATPTSQPIQAAGAVDPAWRDRGWARSPHADAQSTAFRDWDDAGMVPAGCAKCHSATGLPQFLQNGGTVAVSGSSILTTGVIGASPAYGFACSTCHNDLGRFTVYPVANVPFPSGRSITFSAEKDERGNLIPVADNLCLECHQGRQSTVALNARIGNSEDEKVPERKLSFANVHYAAAGASLFGGEAQVAYQYAGKEYSGRNMHVPGFSTCTECHNTHELGLRFDKCVTCHAGVRSADEIRFTSADLDGDEDVKEPIKAEIADLEEKLFAAMQDYAKTVAKADIAYDASAYPYFFADANANGKADAGETSYTEWTPRLLKAAYNYQFVQKDPGVHAHNPKYSAQILFDSLESLNGAGGLRVDMAGLIRPEIKR